MNLPTEKTPIKTDLSDQTILIYGAEKIGKSSFCAEMESALFLATEAGLNHLNVHQVSIDSWESFVNACGSLKAGKHKFQTAIIDVIDKLYNHCLEYVCEKHGINHPADLSYGKGWALVNNEFSRVLTKLSLLPYGLVLVAHAKEQEFDERTGKYTKVLPNLSGGASKVVTGMSDFILYFTNEITTNGEDVSEKRVIYTKSNKFYDAGDRTGFLPESIDLNYPAFIKEYEIAIEKEIEKESEKENE